VGALKLAPMVEGSSKLHPLGSACNHSVRESVKEARISSSWHDVGDRRARPMTNRSQR